MARSCPPCDRRPSFTKLEAPSILSCSDFRGWGSDQGEGIEEWGIGALELSLSWLCGLKSGAGAVAGTVTGPKPEPQKPPAVPFRLWAFVSLSARQQTHRYLCMYLPSIFAVYVHICIYKVFIDAAAGVFLGAPRWVK